MNRFMRCARAAIIAVAWVVSGVASADVVDELLQQYRAAGGDNFSAAAGEKMWDRGVLDPRSGETRRCATCHSTDLKRTGKHAQTGKAIKPLAPSANPERLTDKAHVEKWLSRNCKWTYSRECSPQEKGDALVFIKSR